MTENTVITRAELAHMIDHTLLAPEATDDDVARLAKEAGQLGVGAICMAAGAGGADFVKTSTGFHPAGGATVEAVRAMADAVGGRLGVKAAGGIRTTADALAMIAAGATRIGASRTAALSGEFAEEQMSALLMAIFWRGMTAAETAEWTGAMIASGSRADLSGLGRPSVDKHSTGGVGDKLSLIIVPLVAVFGAAVPQMSGRGLGHTGGTLDKLESIPAGTPTWIPPHCSGCWTRSAAAGVMCLAKPGEPVAKGQPVLELCGDDPSRLDAARAELTTAIDIGDEPPSASPLIIERIGC